MYGPVGILTTGKRNSCQYFCRLPSFYFPNAGVVQGDIIAKGILSAMEELRVSVPVVTRIQGTNGKLGMQMVRIVLTSLT
jgi:hypothetical protein